VVQTPEGEDDREVLDATHYIVNGEVTHLYLGARSDGISVTVPTRRCIICRSDKARELFSADIDSRTGDGSGSDSDGHSDRHADSDEPEIVADGGTVIESGDIVTHSGEQWRVARSDGARVEIYQLGARSLIVPADTVEPVPEVRA
jgi:hypothetical protein